MSNKPLLIYCGHHKCGSVWIRGIVENISKALGLEYFNGRNGNLYKHNLKGFVKENNIDFIALANARLEDVENIINFRGFHVIRDPRDICVSAYYSHRYSHSAVGLEDIREQLHSSSPEEGLMLVIKDRVRQFEMMHNWDYFNPYIMEIKMEQLISDSFVIFRRIFDFLGLSGESGLTDGLLHEILETQSFEKKSGGRKPGEEDIKSHFRKGISGDWKNHFTSEHIEYFREHYNDLLIKLGYEIDSNWGLSS